MKRRSLEPRSVIGGRYRITGVLGEGGMGTVYLADDMKLGGKQWAVKQYAAGGAEPLADEAELLSRLNHPALPQIVDCLIDEETGGGFLIMEYIRGSNLQELFESRGGRMEVRDVIGFGCQLCDLLGYLHGGLDAPVIYRDLKPSNIMLDDQGRIRLIDFGIARSFKPGHPADTVQIGTVGFAAPEQFEGRQSDARTDLYGLGALLYYLLSGGQLYAFHPMPLLQIAPDTPGKLARLVDKLLQADPEQRLQTAEETRRQLQDCLSRSRWFGERQGLRRMPEQSASPMLERRTVVFTPLYPGAGATFASIAAARALHGFGVGHALVESPSNQPELYSLLFGERNAPRGYVSLTERLAGGRSASAGEWRSGSTVWYPLPPGYEPVSAGPVQHGNILLGAVRSPVVLIDMAAADFSVPEGEQLLDQADLIVAVGDGRPSKWALAATRERVRRLEARLEQGQNVWLIANRDVNAPGRKEWLQRLPLPLLCTLSEVPYRETAAAAWSGTLVQDRKEAATILSRELMPILRLLVPDKLLRSTERRRRYRLFGGL